MSDIEYVMRERTGDRDNLDNGLYFSNRNNPVYVERSVSRTYEYDSASGRESDSDALDDDTRELKKTYTSKTKNILFLGSIGILIILLSVSLGIYLDFHALSDDSVGKLQ